MSGQWKGVSVTFDRACDFELECARIAGEGALVLCKTARLARRILHVYRMTEISRGARGWATPDIRPFAGWVRERHEMLWDRRRPLSRCAALRLWHDAVKHVSVPDGLEPGPPLYEHLQYSLDILRDNCLEPCGRGTGHELADFRRSATKRFFHLAEERGFILWADVLSALEAGCAGGAGFLPAVGKIVLAGFDVLSPREAMFLELLGKYAAVESWNPAANPAPGSVVRLYATPEQECAAVCAEILRSWNSGHRNLGLVFMDNAHFELIKRALDELAGVERPEFERAIRYNLTRGTPLSLHPLFQTAVLPLRVAGEILPGPALASLFVSPYIEKTSGDWNEKLRSVLWDVESPPSLAGALKALRATHPAAGIERLAGIRRAKLDVWLEMLMSVLRDMGFPRLEEGMQRTRDMLAMRHIEKIVRDFSLELGDMEMSAGQVHAWLSDAAEHVVVSEKTSEITGIQILSVAESRGMSFSKLWVTGMHGRAFPEPARDLPFLDPDEQKAAAENSPEARWEKARRDLARLCAAAPDIEFSRSASNGDDAPNLPCPLIPDELGEDGKPLRRVLSFWENPPREWSRAAWLRKSRTKRIDPKKQAGDSDECPGLGEEISVTSLGDLVDCPALFFCKHALHLDTLKEPGAGIDPLIRGRVVHDIMKNIVEGLPKRAPDWPEDDGAALDWVREAAGRELAKQPDDLFWRVERIRLLGTQGFAGVLAEWLEAERMRARECWRFAGTEISFSGLVVGGTKLRGRVDRVDWHEAEGFAVWDYKTGDKPGDAAVVKGFGEPQLPAYVLALRRGLLSGFAPGVRLGETRAASVRMGYISLKKASDVRVQPVGDGRKPLDLDVWMTAWERATAERMDLPKRGIFKADPVVPAGDSFDRRRGVCRYCEFYNICGYFDAPGAFDEEADDGAWSGES